MASSKNSLGDRMKRFESTTRFLLNPKTPVIVRVDGKAFHSYTKGMKRPYDNDLIEAMATAAKRVAEEMQGFKVGYVQSDEASFLLTDWENFDTDQWFGGTLQKITSVSASLMTAFFNQEIAKKVEKKTLAIFDSRVFNVPQNDVANYLLWRAKDWARNSIQMLAQSHFSHKQLHGKKITDMHEMLYSKGVNWTADTTAQQRNGTFLLSTVDGIEQRFDILPNYDTISDIVDSRMMDPALNFVLNGPELEQYDDPDARPIEDILPEDEKTEWKQWLKDRGHME